MKFGTGTLLVAAGLFILWLATTGRLDRVPGAWGFIVNGAGPAGSGGSSTAGVPPV